MLRLTARLLLVVLLIGIFTPVALAISTPPVHACCMRKPLHDHASHQAQFQALDCCQHNCCRPLTVARWAQPRPPVGAHRDGGAVIVFSEAPTVRPATILAASQSVRAPPSSFLT